MSEFFSAHPEVLAILIAVAGFAIATLAAKLLTRWFLALEAYLRRVAPQRFERLNLALVRRALTACLYYGLLIIFVLAALQTLGIAVVQQWLDLLLQHVPQLILGGLIILSGYLIGVVVRTLLAGLMGVAPDHLVPRLAQLLVVTTAVLTGLAQTAFDISFISNVMVILLAFFFGGLSLAFALGSRSLVENLLARRALDRYRVGDTVVLGDSSGKIVEILSTSIILETDRGLLTIPTARFVDSEVLLVVGEEAEGETDARE